GDEDAGEGGQEAWREAADGEARGDGGRAPAELVSQRADEHAEAPYGEPRGQEVVHGAREDDVPAVKARASEAKRGRHRPDSNRCGNDSHSSQTARLGVRAPEQPMKSTETVSRRRVMPYFTTVSERNGQNIL